MSKGRRERKQLAVVTLLKLPAHSEISYRWHYSMLPLTCAVYNVD
jgi:hypothetical protein